MQPNAPPIFINGRFLSQNITGVQRYALELVHSIDKLLGNLHGHQGSFTLLVPPNAKQLPALQHVAIKSVGYLRGHLWEQVELPFYSRNGLLVGFCNTGPLFKADQIVTLCDASVYRVPEAYSFLFRLWYRILFTTIGHLSRGLLTISVFSRDELASCCGIKPEKFTVTYPGIDHHNWTGVRETKSSNHAKASNRAFVLAVSSMSPHKNFRALVEATDLLGEVDFDVIIAGGTNPAVFRDTDIPLPDTVKHVGYVSDDELKSLYSHAACFIYPSLYEGFGLPPLEAMANGCPTVVANAGSLPEVCGEAVLYCDPRNPQDIADKINRAMSDVKLREDLRTKGFNQAEKYTWAKCARETLAAIEKALAL